MLLSGPEMYFIYILYLLNLHKIALGTENQYCFQNDNVVFISIHPCCSIIPKLVLVQPVAIEVMHLPGFTYIPKRFTCSKKLK